MGMNKYPPKGKINENTHKIVIAYEKRNQNIISIELNVTHLKVKI